MAEITIHVPETLLHQLPKNQKDLEEVMRLGLEHFTARRHKKTSSVVDRTFAALPMRKHTLIEQVIEQTKYGE
jgi:hypothetical protein